MSTIAKESSPVKVNPNDPRRDKQVIYYDKEQIKKISHE